MGLSANQFRVRVSSAQDAVVVIPARDQRSGLDLLLDIASRGVIVDYGMGTCGACRRVRRSAMPRKSRATGRGARASKVVPGQGVSDAMTELRAAAHRPDPRSIDAEKPTLGICLGLQLLFETGTEEAATSSASFAARW
jgi:glutamine amidotransferase